MLQTDVFHHFPKSPRIFLLPQTTLTDTQMLSSEQQGHPVQLQKVKTLVHCATLPHPTRGNSKKVVSEILEIFSHFFLEKLHLD